MHQRLAVQRLEDRNVPAVHPWAQFVLDMATYYARSDLPADMGLPIVSVYKDYFAGGSFSKQEGEFQVLLDGNDRDAGHGPSSYSVQWTPGTSLTNAYFQFGLGAGITDRPRDIPGYGAASSVRFMAKRSSADPTLQLQANVFKTGTTGPVASQFFQLTTSWADYVLTLPPNIRPQDFRAIQFLMDPDHGAAPGSRVWIDEVRISSAGTDPLDLVQSYLADQWAPDNALPDTAQGRDRHVYPYRSYLYDNALAIKALIASGDPSARQIAINIADALIAGVNGANGYLNERKTGHALLFDGTMRPNGSTSQMKTLGDNSWLGMALLDVYRLTGNIAYLNRAIQISDWADNNLRMSGPLRGYRGGYEDNGTPADWRSTEHNIDFFALNSQIARILTGLPNPPAPAATYAEHATHAGDFVVAMFDAAAGKFWTGTTTGDTINQSSVPLDAQLWPLLTLARSPQYAAAGDWSSPLRYAETGLRTTDGALTGFTFSTGSTANRVWLEGVAQGAVVYHLRGDAAKEAQSLQTLGHTAAGGRGLFAASSDSLDDNNLKAHYDRQQGVAPTAWGLFAALGVNPFDPVSPVFVSSVGVNDGSAQRSMVTSLKVTFSTQVTLGTGAFTLVPQGGGTPVSLSFTAAVNNGQTVATITFGGSLADGRYLLTTVAAQVHDLAGTVMTADRQDSLFRLLGDVNGDAAVNGTDLTAFRNAFGATSADANYVWYLDQNGDGAINGTDLTAFRTRFGVILP